MAVFSERLKALRKAKKLTQQQIADRFGITKSAVSRWESGVIQPDIDKIKEIADFFDVTIDFLLGNDANQENKDKKNADLVDLLEEIKKRPYVIDPKTGEAKYIPKERLKIINDLIEGYLREEGILPDDNGNGEDCAGSL
ncbi:helix-turn-helix domain-containing protein [Laceyella sacchari]|uniref:Helix-turn-helix domain-containing protein n=1 Tax=Laceyella sacchari TaxID=37482 RepID=A0ABY5UAF0_LACSH|nr:helix-turn-helix transcriptional regulator [Laceyella sacchari]UWE05297.1 helix-turn-helix domain-containing protein [Laceyella sacchari]